MEKSDFFDHISAYIPDKSVDTIYNIFNKYSVLLVISGPRKSKLGDFRILKKKYKYQISVNGDLNKYEFLITLLHELSHLLIWDEYKNAVKPHGPEWKMSFSFLIGKMLSEEVFPKDLDIILKKEIKSKRLNFTNNNSKLARALESYSENIKYVRLEDIADNSKFTLTTGKKMIKGTKLRTRYKCREISSGRLYYVHKLAKIIDYSEQ